MGFHNEARIPVIRGYQIAVLICRTRIVCNIDSNMLGGASMMVRGINFPQEPIARDCLTKEYCNGTKLSLCFSLFTQALLGAKYVDWRPSVRSSS